MVESRGSAKVNDILHVGRESGADETPTDMEAAGAR